MQTERVTFLTSSAGKASLAARAAARGISVGEYVRRKVEEEDELTPEQEAEFAALVAEANDAIPKMNASLDRMIATLDRTNRDVSAMLDSIGKSG